MVSHSLLSLYLQFLIRSMHSGLRSVAHSCLFYRIVFMIIAVYLLSEIAWFFRLKRHRDGCEVLERHPRTKWWPTPSITHAERMTQFSLSLSLAFSRRVYQCCPEYLTGERAHPWDLICTGVHLVEVVWDNLHIMSHLHPGVMKIAHLREAHIAGQCGRGRGIVCCYCSEDQCVLY